MQARRHRDQSGIDAQLLDLGRELGRLRRRASRLHLVYRRDEDPTSWQRWADAVKGVETTRERIAALTPRSLEGLVIRYLALTSMLLDDSVVVDAVARREVLRFGLVLRRLHRK